MSNADKDLKPLDTGGVVNYLVNIEELGEVIADSLDRASTDGDLSTGIQRSKGFLINSLDYGVERIDWTVPFDIEITGLTFAQEDVRNMGYDDYINIFINEELIVETVYLKEMQEEKTFRKMMEVKEGDIITIEYINDTGISKEFKIDIEYINKEPMNMSPATPPEVSPEDPIPPKPEEEEMPTPPTESLPIYRVYMRYQGGLVTDLDMYVNMFNNLDGSDISTRKTVGFSRRTWGVDTNNLVIMTDVVDNHLNPNAREEEPEIIEIYGKPSNYFRFYVTNYKKGELLTESVSVEIFKVDSNGNDGLLIGKIEKNSARFKDSNAKVHFFNFNIDNESIVEL